MEWKFFKSYYRQNTEYAAQSTLKAARGGQHHFRRQAHQMITAFFNVNVKTLVRTGKMLFMFLKDQNCQTGVVYSAKVYVMAGEESKPSCDKKRFTKIYELY